MEYAYECQDNPDMLHAIKNTDEITKIRDWYENPRHDEPINKYYAWENLNELYCRRSDELKYLKGNKIKILN